MTDARAEAERILNASYTETQVLDAVTAVIAARQAAELCHTCNGRPHVSGLVCICGGTGKVGDEIQGLRDMAVFRGNAAASAEQRAEKAELLSAKLNDALIDTGDQLAAAERCMKKTEGDLKAETEKGTRWFKERNDFGKTAFALDDKLKASRADLAAAEGRERALKDTLQEIAFMGMDVAAEEGGGEHAGFYKERAYFAISTAAHALSALAAPGAGKPDGKLHDAVVAMAGRWMNEQAAYPVTPEGHHAAAAVRLCSQELLRLILKGSPDA